MKLPPILDVGGVLISSDILTEQFCCDYEKCKGICCVEGDAGAPVTLDEITAIEEVLDDVWPELSASAQSVIDRQGVAYADRDGDMVTSIVRGRDCVFTCYDGDNCLCALEKVARQRQASNVQSSADNVQCSMFNVQSSADNVQCSMFNVQSSSFVKPISCALYPIRERVFDDGTVALNYHRWSVCADAREKGKALGLPVYRFLKEPLVRRFGQAWYDELCEVAALFQLS